MPAHRDGDESSERDRRDEDYWTRRVLGMARAVGGPPLVPEVDRASRAGAAETASSGSKRGGENEGHIPDRPPPAADDRSSRPSFGGPAGEYGRADTQREAHDLARQRHHRGQHRGVGPKGYERSDDRVLEDVCERMRDADIDVSAIAVEVHQGVVTLSGDARSREDQRMLEAMARACAGVTEVEDRSRVAPAPDLDG